MKTKKRILAGLSAFMMIASVTGSNFPGFATSGHSAPIISAADTGSVLKTAKGLEYFVDDDGNAVISGYSGWSADVVVPDEIDGHAVTEIADEAFAGNTAITNVKLGKVKVLGARIFKGCSKLKEIVIPNTVTISFKGPPSKPDECSGSLEGSNIETVIFEDGIEEIPSLICKNASSVSNIVLPENAGASFCGIIGFYAFSGTSIQTITIPGSFRVAFPNAFENCTKLTEVKFPDNFRYIDNYCFSGCTSLRKVDLGSSIYLLGNSVFDGCTSLNELIIPKSIMDVSGCGGEWSGCNIETLVFEDGTTKIYSSFARNLTTLKNVYLPDSIEIIGSSAFSGCTNLENLICSKTDFSFYDSTFEGCDKLSLNGFDNSESYFFTANTDLTKVNDIVNFKVKYKLDPKTAISAKDMKFQLNIPDGMVILPYSIQSQNLTINTKDAERGIIPFNCSISGDLYFSARIIELGDHRVSASLNYNCKNVICEQQIGETTINCPGIIISAPETVDSFTVGVHGLADKNKKIEIYVNDTLTETLTSNTYTGRYNGNIIIPKCKNGTVNSVYAKCGDTKSEVIKITYSNEKPIIQNVSLGYYFHSYAREPSWLDITDSFNQGVSPVVSYYPNNPISFEVTSSNNDKINKMYVTSTKGNDVKYLEAFYNKETGTWITKGNFDKNNTSYVPGALNISIIEKEAKKSDELIQSLKENAVFQNPCFVRFIIDPSGIVYEAVMGNPIEGAETTIYYLDPETEKAVKWNAEDYDQINPLISDEAGWYAWDVPEGLWKVVCKKEGYETVETEWMDVPPVRTDVHIGLVNKDAPKITGAELTQKGIVVKFSKFIDISTVTADTLKVSGFDGKYKIAPQRLSSKDVYADTFLIDGDFGKDIKSISITNGIISYAGTAAKAASVSLTVSPDFDKPEIREASLIYTNPEGTRPTDVTGVIAKGLSNTVNCAPAEMDYFEITASNNDKIFRMFVTTSFRGNIRYSEAFYNSETGTWIADNDLKNFYESGTLNISIIESETDIHGIPLSTALEKHTVSENPGPLKFAYGNDAVQAVVSGDVNGDGEVNAADLVMLIKNMLGAGTVTSIQNADLNKDKTVNIIDLCMLKALLLEQ